MNNPVISKEVKQGERETWWCEICMVDRKAKLTDYFKAEDLRNHYRKDHTKEQLISCIEDFSTNPCMYDPDKDNEVK